MSFFATDFISNVSRFRRRADQRIPQWCSPSALIGQNGRIGEWGGRRMRYPAAEKLEIIRLVDAGSACAGADRHPEIHVLSMVRSSSDWRARGAGRLQPSACLVCYPLGRIASNEVAVGSGAAAYLCLVEGCSKSLGSCSLEAESRAVTGRSVVAERGSAYSGD
jgi:hypothetical protein